MELKDWLPIMFERANATAALWNMQIVVVLGLIAFMASAGELARNRSVLALLTVGLVVMAGLNLSAQISVTEQRLILLRFIGTLEDRAISGGLVSDLTDPSHFPYPLQVAPMWLVIALHVTVDAAALLFVWIYPNCRRRSREVVEYVEGAHRFGAPLQTPQVATHEVQR